MTEEPRYSLAGQSLIAPAHAGINGIRRIDGPEFLRFQSAIQQIFDFSIHHALFQICETNFRELMLCYEKAREEFNKSHRIDEIISNNTLNQINRLLLNYLSSFKTMIDHYQTRYTRLDRSGSQYLCAFRISTGNIFDASFSYRFMYQLRNYVQHCGLPVGSVGAQVFKNDTGQTVADLAVYFDRDSLLSKYDRWGRVKNELQAQPARIEISVHLVEFHHQVLEIYKVLAKTELGIVKEAHQYLSSLVTEVHNQMPDARPVIVDFSQLSASGGNLPVLVIPVMELERIQQIENVFGSG